MSFSLTRYLLAGALLALFVVEANVCRATQDSGRDQPWTMHVIDDTSQGADGVKLADINGDGRLDIATGWEEGGETRVYLHPGPSKVKLLWPKVTVGRTPSVEDAVFFDLTGDGDLDVVSSLEGRARKIMVHSRRESDKPLLDPKSWSSRDLPASVDRMQWMFAWPASIDATGGVDLIAGGKGNGAEVGWFEAPEKPADLDSWVYHSITKAGWIMSLWPTDVDGDGDLDAIISDRYGPQAGCRWLENPLPNEQPSRPWKSHSMGAMGLEVLSMCLIDLDNDGLQDAVVAIKSHELRWLRRLDRTGLRWEEHTIPVDYDDGNTRAVEAADLDLDGRLDLVYTTWNAQGKHGIRWLSYGKSVFDSAWTPHPLSGKQRGIKYDRIELIDLDEDGDLDLLTCEEREGGSGLGVIWYENPFAEPSVEQ